MTPPKNTFLYELHQIAVASDLLPPSNLALKAAHQLTTRARAELTAIHVIPPIPAALDRVLFPYAALGPDRHDFEAELLEAGRRQLLEFTGPVTGEDEIYAHIFYGSPHERILDSLSRISAQLLAIGAGGNSAPTPGSLGTTASRLAASPLRPLWIVKNSMPCRRALVLIDLSSASTALLNYAMSFLLHFENPDLEILCVIPNPSLIDPNQLLELTVGPMRKVTKKARTLIERRIEAFRSELYIPFPLLEPASHLSFLLHTPYGDVVEQALETITERDIDTVILATHHPDSPTRAVTLGRNAEAIIRRAGTNVLVVPTHLLSNIAELEVAS